MGNGERDGGTGSRALARQRQELILSEIRRHGAVRVSDLVTRLGVSDMTVRRDLDVLASAGRLTKVHGGATSVDAPSSEEPGFEAKSSRQQAEKVAIAKLAAGLVSPGTAIGMTAGTTTWQMAHYLTEVPDLIVVTNSVRVADVLHHAHGPNATVILTGGVRTPSDALVGPVALGALRTLHLDQVFMGVHGMSERAGFSTPNLMEAETNRAFLEASQRLVVLADHTKWGINGLSSIAALREASVLVTDADLAPEALGVLQRQIGQVLEAVPDNVHPLERNA